MEVEHQRKLRSERRANAQKKEVKDFEHGQSYAEHETSRLKSPRHIQHRIAKLGNETLKLVRTSQNQHISQRRIQLELKKSQRDQTKLKETLKKVLDRQRAADKQVVTMRGVLDRISTSKEKLQPLAEHRLS